MRARRRRTKRERERKRRRKRKERSRVGSTYVGTRTADRSLVRRGEEVIDGTSVMVQPSISRAYTFIIYYPPPLRILCAQVRRALPLPRISRVSLCLRWSPNAQAMHRRGPKAAPVTMQLTSHGPRPRASIRHSIRSAA